MYLPIVIVIYIVIVMVNYHRQYCWNPLSPKIEQQLKMFCQSLPIIYLRFVIISKTHPCLAAYWRRLNVSVFHLVIRTQMNLLALFISFFVNYFLFGVVCSFLVTSYHDHLCLFGRVEESFQFCNWVFLHVDSDQGSRKSAEVKFARLHELSKDFEHVRRNTCQPG